MNFHTLHINFSTWYVGYRELCDSYIFQLKKNKIKWLVNQQKRGRSFNLDCTQEINFIYSPCRTWMHEPDFKSHSCTFGSLVPTKERQWRWLTGSEWMRERERKIKRSIVTLIPPHCTISAGCCHDSRGIISYLHKSLDARNCKWTSI